MPARERYRKPDEGVSIRNVFRALLPPLLLTFAVLGSILGGYATPTETAGVGGMGALLMALARGQLNLERLQEIMRSTLRISSMVFLILIGASILTLVFPSYGGADGVRAVLEALPGGVISAVVVVMLAMFPLGFVLDFIEITFVVVSIVGHYWSNLPRRVAVCCDSTLRVAVDRCLSRACYLVAREDIRQLALL